IGEFVLFRKDFSLKEVLDDARIELSVDTTYYLLKKLDEHELDIAIVAGIFDIMMNLFKQKNISLEQFKNMNEIANINVIKNLVMQNKGISFLFETSILENLEAQ